jgi:hypothetical protein
MGQSFDILISAQVRILCARCAFEPEANFSERGPTMLVISTIYFAYLEPDAENDKIDLAGVRDVIEKKLMEQPDPNRKLVVVYAGTGRGTGED